MNHNYKSFIYLTLIILFFFSFYSNVAYSTEIKGKKNPEELICQLGEHSFHQFKNSSVYPNDKNYFDSYMILSEESTSKLPDKSIYFRIIIAKPLTEIAINEEFEIKFLSLIEGMFDEVSDDGKVYISFALWNPTSKKVTKRGKFLNPNYLRRVKTYYDLIMSDNKTFTEGKLVIKNIDNNGLTFEIDNVSNNLWLTQLVEISYSSYSGAGLYTQDISKSRITEETKLSIKLNVPFTEGDQE